MHDLSPDASAERPGGSARSSPRALRRRLAVVRRALDRALPLLPAGSSDAEAARGVEWLLDNSHLLAEAEEQVAEALSRGFLRTLPVVPPERGGGLRAEELARGLLAAGDWHVDVDRAVAYLASCPADPPLTMGELWALPALLRLLLLEEVAGAAATLAGLEAERRAVAALVGGDPARVGLHVESLRVLSRLDWSGFFERASSVHRVLARDPAGAYGRMDFDTRDRYRKRVEWLARRSGRTEEAVAAAAVDAASRAPPEAREGHVGYWLVDAGRGVLAVSLGAQGQTSLELHRALVRAGPALYLAAVSALTALVLGVLALPVLRDAHPPAVTALALVLALLPASAGAAALLNWIITQLRPPRVLPKLDFRDGIPAGCETAVVVPALLSDADEVDELLRQLELNWHGNADRRIVFALLADFTDAPREEMPADAELLRRAGQGVRALNARHGGGGRQPFLLLRRGREWNAAQGCWMAWERKRGKIEDFNALVLGLPSRLSLEVGERAELERVRYVVTLDADTFLPREAAARLAGVLAHPLNRAVFDERGRVAAGYTVLQPRVELLPTSMARTPFARVFEGDRGVDLYTRAVSDVYQDLFGEGNYAGKGIYDVAAFHRSLEGRVPENALLSHDLFEGVHGRAALVSDVAVYEDYPGHLLAYLRRLHRWVRGDWQLLPWLAPRVPAAEGRRTRSPLSLLDRWKVADNLRRSLVAPSLLLLLAAGWTVLPRPGWWTGAALALLGGPLMLAAAGAGRGWARARVRRMTAIRRGDGALVLLVRWALMAAFLPVHAAVEADAAARTLARVLFTRRRLLEWTSAAHAARDVRSGRGAALLWRRMAAAPLIAAALVPATALVRPSALPVAAPLLAAWLLSPALAALVSRPAEPRSQALSGDDVRFLRALARRTWGYFDRFTGPDEHWLPPDNFQEEPPVGVARRTSPTNVGLMALSTLAAYDLGYVTLSELAARLDNTFDTLEELERHRGHFLNWYGTHDQAPLEPRYVSTVDSGNLACALLALAAGCEEAAAAPVLHPEAARGLADALDVFAETVAPMDAGTPRAVQAAIAELRARLSAADPRDRARTLVELTDTTLPELEAAVASLVEERVGTVAPGDIARVRLWMGETLAQASMLRREAESFLPWLFLPADPPPALGSRRGGAAVASAWEALRGADAPPPSLADLPARCARADAALRRLEDALAPATAGAPERAAAAAWTRDFAARIEGARRRAAELSAQLVSIGVRAAAMAGEMNFSFLYDGGRHLFHIGYNVSSGRLDGSYYDLLASEARLASLFAIAHGQVPTRHWLHLGRPLTRAGGEPVMLSWSGSMFEYLLPALLVRTAPRSLLEMACRAAVERHIAHGARHRVPWGVSESAYAEVDAHHGYQYRAFGVPDLALRRDEGERLVVAPYASALALAWAPRAAVENLRRLGAMGMVGAYGLFDALDFGPRARWTRREGAPVRTWMAHHQGMVLLALDNLLNGAPMVERFHRHPAIAAAELLLHEQVPGRVRPEPRTPARPAAAARAALSPRGVAPWRVPAEAGAPEAHVLSNGTLSTLVTSWGSGGIRLGERAVTRWDPDPALEPWGTWIYLRDLDSGTLWSATAAPAHAAADACEVAFAPHLAEFRRRRDGISTRLVVAVAPGAPVELRRLVVANEGRVPRRLRVASCGEPVLADAAAYRRHPAFSKLFLESAFHADPPTLVFRRRTASVEEPSVQLGHTVVHGPGARFAGWETDRARFLGRGGSPGAPAGLLDPAGLTGSSGTVLDPVFVLACDVVLAPGAEVEIAFLTAAAGSEREVRAHLDAFRSPGRVAWAMEEARARSEHELHELGVAPHDARALQLLLARIVHPFAAWPAEAREGGALARQQALWGQGISGDLPILLLRVGPGEEAHPLLPLMVRAHAYWRRAGVRADLVILDEEPGGYTEPLRDRVYATLAEGGAAHWLDRPGGVYHVPAARLSPEARAAVEAAAAVRVDAEGGPLAEQLAAPPPPPRLPAFVPVRSAPPSREPTPPVERPADLLFDCGVGGFGADGREYVIHLEPGDRTPAPWINVVANPGFGFAVSETGAGFTWSGNSGEHRLTPWANDPLLDPPGEALYLRDEETAEVWSPTPGPRPAEAAYQVRHGAGYTRFLHASHGLEQEVLAFVPRAGTVKVVRVALRNLWKRQRRVTVTYYAEWVLGTDRRAMAPHVATELEPELGAVLARQRFRDEPGERVAFLAASEPRHGATADRAEFLGMPGSLSRPAALERIGLGETYGEGIDPCAALQVHVDLGPGEAKTLHFLLGDGADRAEALETVRRFRDPAAVEAARAEVGAFWDGLLGRLQVRTPEPAMDLLLNRWLPYQALACRLWGRSALYQSGGAFGFRDQLQDVTAFLSTAPELARAHLLEAASRQFAEGDVLHWWHPPAGAGVRTRCSDDLLWLPFAVAAYVEATGDAGVLDEAVPYLAAPELRAGEEQRYDRYGVAPERGTLYEHCLRAIERGSTRGAHGLPLIGTGDWNDAMDRVGAGGEGESVWLGWFLYAVLLRFAPLCEGRGDGARARRFRERADDLRKAVEAEGWDGGWYRRAWFDDGTPLGSAESTEGKIDSLTQSWAVLSGGADPERARAAMEAVAARLLREDDRLVLLLDPPFDRIEPSPGYIRAYPPGVRENGGQYTHAAAWAAWAFAALGDGERAESIFRLLNPVLRVGGPAEAERYRVEPYVVPADVYGVPPHTGRGGWTWYTGSAAWLWRLGAEAILGIRRRGGSLEIDPCIPAAWEGFEAEYRFGAATYRITVRNPDGVRRGVGVLELDGRTLGANRFPLEDDGREHAVSVRMGGAAPAGVTTGGGGR